MPANVLEARDNMESTRLLSSNEEKGRKGKWGGRFMKRIFRRENSKKHYQSKIQQHSEPIAETEGGEESIADRYFSALKDTSVSSGIEELDHTTVNLSYSAGSNPYSTDESYEADARASWRRKMVAKQRQRSTTNTSLTRNGKKYGNSDVSSNSDPTATSTSFHNTASFGNTENSFVQLDVPKMQKLSSSPNTSAVQKCLNDDFDGTSFDSETGIFDIDGDIPFVFHTHSSTSRVLEDTCPTIGSPTIVSDHGMEVVLFDSDIAGINLDVANNETDDDIFMSFQLPPTGTVDPDEWRDPFKSNAMKTIFPEITPMVSSSASKENKTSTPVRKYSIDFEHGNHEGGDAHKNIPPSPALSLRSETSVTWVSHDDDDADERPMKEIHVPNAENGVDVFFDQDSINEIAVENIISESLLTPQSSNNTIFASTPVVDEKQAESQTFATAAASFPFFWNSPNNVTSVRSACTPQSAPALVTTQPQQQQYRLSPRRVQSSTNAAKDVLSNFVHSFERKGCNNDGPIAVSPLAESPSIQLKTPSSAFLKRKSVFMGEDLLSQEAESFAEFLEDHNQPIVLDKPEKLASTSPILSAKVSPTSESKNSISHTNISAAERLLFAMTESVDNSEADGSEDQYTNDEIIDITASLFSPVVLDIDATAATTATSNLIASSNVATTPVTESVDMSYPGISTMHSLATSRTGSTDIFSKSLSDEDADDEEEEEELTNNASASYASSCTSYAPSTLQGSRSSGVKYTRSRSNSIGVKHLPYCGVFIREDIGEDDEEEYEEDDLSLPSEDFSVHRGGTHIRQYRTSSLPPRRSSSRQSSSNTTIDGTPLLDQVRNELLETVQDLAREGSSVVLKFLRQRP